MTSASLGGLALHHTGVVVEDLDDAEAKYRALGFTDGDRISVPEQGVEAIIYEFWHHRSNNLIATFDTEAEARRALTAWFDDSSALAAFVLTWDDVDEAAEDTDDDVDRPGGLVAYREALVEIARGGPFPPLVNVFTPQS